ncbi:MAG: PAS domain S-box protein [Acidimicrobiia bacterium]
MTSFGGEPACSAHLFDEAAEPDDAALAQLVRDLADAVVICDRDGIITFWNHAATTLFGWSALEAAGKTLRLIVPERLWGRHESGYARVMKTGETEYGGGRVLEVPATHRGGRTISIAFTVTVLYNAGQRAPSGIAAVIRDDTARWLERRALRSTAQPSGDGSDG